jgi:hypothetical protein
LFFLLFVEDIKEKIMLDTLGFFSSWFFLVALDGSVSTFSGEEKRKKDD